MYKKTKLDNGVRVITYAMPKMKSISIGIWINVGGRFESVQDKGISHYLEHLVFKGTKSYSYRKLKESVEGKGGSLNGFTAEEMTCFLVKLPCEYLDLGLDVLSDMVINPLIPKDEVEKERFVILEELKMYRDLPQSYVYELLDELLWPRQLLGMSIIGTVESINSINQEKLRLFKENYYTPDNIVISIAGALNHASCVEKVEKKFSFLKTRSFNTFSKVIEEDTVPKSNIFYKDTEQTHIALGFHGFDRAHPLRYAQSLLHVILGGNMSSRLFNEVRENRGLAYEIGTQVKRFKDTGAFLVHAGIDNKKINQAVELILMELKKIRSEVVTLDELKRAKEFFLGQLEMALEDTMEYMLWIGESTVALDKAYYLEEVVEIINKLKRENIKEAAENLFKENKIHLALIGPVKESELGLSKNLKMS